ncbi:hypothetical protein ACTNCL_05305 [Segatella copri]|uniref:hypothetical protein n=1 Tax=Segatella copri TaxID=165179 RepID=UPI003F88F729
MDIIWWADFKSVGAARAEVPREMCHQNQYALKGQKLLAQGIALGRYVCKPVAL